MTSSSRRSGSDEVRDALRRAAEESDGGLDELTRARMEKKLLGAVHGSVTHRLANQPFGAEDVTRGRRLWGRLAVGAAIASVAAAALFVVITSGQDDGPSEAANGATFRSFEDGMTVGRGGVVVGQTISTTARERMEVWFAGSRVDVTPGSVARFDRLDLGRVEVQLSRGAVEVEFHPKRRGEESLVIETASSRVEVVGTIFRVEVDLVGSTTVRVVEGIVRVIPHDGSEPRLVHAGDETVVASLVASREPRGDEERPAWLESAEDQVLAGAPIDDQRAASGHDGDDVGVTEELRIADDLSAPTPETGSAPAGSAPAGSAPGGVVAATAPPLSLDARFDLAETLLARGRHAESRHLLHAIARAPEAASDRVRAWTLIAESHAAEQDFAGATEAYRRAASAGGRSIGAQNALYALGRLRERQVHDREGAVAAYRRYLELAPEGAHATRVRAALCRLGEREHCE